MIKPKLIFFSSLLFIIISSITACSKNKVLSRDKIVAVLHDIQLAEAIYQVKYKEFQSSERKEELVAGVLEKHGITQAQLDSSLVWYSDHMEIYLKVNDSVASTLKRESSKLGRLLPGGGYGIRVNNSVLPGYFYLTNTSPSLTFSIDSAQMHRYPDFNIHFKTLGFNSSMESEAVVYFVYPDTIIDKQYKLSDNTFYEITKPVVNDTLRSVSGYFYLSEKPEDQKALIYDLVLNDSIRTKDAAVPDLSK